MGVVLDENGMILKFVCQLAGFGDARRHQRKPTLMERPVHKINVCGPAMVGRGHRGRQTEPSRCDAIRNARVDFQVPNTSRGHRPVAPDINRPQKVPAKGIPKEQNQDANELPTERIDAKKLIAVDASAAIHTAIAARTDPASNGTSEQGLRKGYVSAIFAIRGPTWLIVKFGTRRSGVQLEIEPAEVFTSIADPCLGAILPELFARYLIGWLRLQPIHSPRGIAQAVIANVSAIGELYRAGD